MSGQRSLARPQSTRQRAGTWDWGHCTLISRCTGPALPRARHYPGPDTAEDRNHISCCLSTSQGEVTKKRIISHWANTIHMWIDSFYSLCKLCIMKKSRICGGSTSDWSAAPAGCQINWINNFLYLGLSSSLPIIINIAYYMQQWK